MSEGRRTNTVDTVKKGLLCLLLDQSIKYFSALSACSGISYDTTSQTVSQVSVAAHWDLSAQQCLAENTDQECLTDKVGKVVKKTEPSAIHAVYMLDV